MAEQQSPGRLPPAPALTGPLPAKSRFDRRDESGPFDVVGDVHSCSEELSRLLEHLGYRVTEAGIVHPEGRRLVFVGDFADKGPDPLGVYRIVMKAASSGALAVRGNHDEKLLRWSCGARIMDLGSIGDTARLIMERGPETLTEIACFLASLPHHLLLDGGRLVVAHGAAPAEVQGRDDKEASSVFLFGVTDRTKDENGFPVRQDWASGYEGPFAVYGHAPWKSPHWHEHAVGIDTGCVFGNALSALRWPETEIVSVQARAAYVKHPSGLPAGRPRQDRNRPSP
jgi:diadenosine tetraphosphatase ApaH/serine/threonine PP2A family protein phosphatase